MKKLIIALIAIAGIFTADTAQAGDRMVTVIHKGQNTEGASPKTVATIPAGVVFEIVCMEAQSNNTMYVYITIDSVQFTKTNNSTVIVGPATIALHSGSGNDGGFLTYKIYPNPAE